MDKHDSTGPPDHNNLTRFLLQRPSPSDPLFIAILVLLLLLSVSGVLGNALVLYTTLRQRPKRATDVFIALLAISDLLVCLVLIPDSISCLFLVENSAHVKVNQDIKAIFSVHTALLMMCIAFDRLGLAVSVSVKWLRTFYDRHGRIRALSAAFASLLISVSIKVSLLNSFRTFAVVTLSVLSVCVLFVFVDYTTIVVYVSWKGRSLRKVTPETPRNTVPAVGGSGHTLPTVTINVQPAIMAASRTEVNEVTESPPTEGGSSTTQSDTSKMAITDCVLVHATDTTNTSLSKGRTGKRKAPFSFTNKHRSTIKVAKLLLVINLVFAVSYVPILMAPTGIIPRQYLKYSRYSTYLANSANPFIYCLGSSKFRAALMKSIFKLRLLTK